MKVGDYARTENGIDKVAGYRYEPEYENGHVVWFEKSDSGCRFTDKDLPKTSPNIIDLIEVGDYVNGEKIIETSTDHCGRKILIYGYNNGDRQVAITIYKEDIKSIVTKEQFASMEYKVGE